MSLQDEFEVISLIKRTLGKPSKRVELAIGDDAAVVRSPKGHLIATVDTLVEGIHFDLSYMNPNELGHKALAVNLSDIAAMGATPLYALVSIGLKQELNSFFVEEMYRGIRDLAKKFHVDIIGGNTVQSPTAVIVDVTVLGEAKKVVTRSGARPGDLIAVSGPLGGSTAGLNTLKRLGRHAMPEELEGLLDLHLRPMPRVKEALELMKSNALTSMLDISDGLARDLHHIMEMSKVGALVDEAEIPIHKLARKAAEWIHSDARNWALCGGEDYELLMTLDPRKLNEAKKAVRRVSGKLYVIGRVCEKSKGVKIRRLDGEIVPLEPMGWNHFVRRTRIKTDPNP